LLMSTIIRIERQRGSKGRYRVFLEDGTSFFLQEELLIKYGLKPGLRVDIGRLGVWLKEDEIKIALNRAIRYLGFRSRSQKEVENYLQRKGFCTEVVEEVIEKLKGYGYIDDMTFAKEWVSNRMRNNPKGKRTMVQELRAKGVHQNIIDNIMSTITDEEEEALALVLVEKYYKRYKGLEEREMVYRIGQALARRGFQWELIQRVIRRYLIML
jgi:regulatory protein